MRANGHVRQDDRACAEHRARSDRDEPADDDTRPNRCERSDLDVVTDRRRAVDQHVLAQPELRTQDAAGVHVASGADGGRRRDDRRRIDQGVAEGPPELRRFRRGDEAIVRGEQRAEARPPRNRRERGGIDDDALVAKEYGPRAVPDGRRNGMTEATARFRILGDDRRSDPEEHDRSRRLRARHDTTRSRRFSAARTDSITRAISASVWNASSGRLSCMVARRSLTGNSPGRQPASA